ncbi:Uncharacterised protein [Vibrio cholerae]|nr:Uncharacterised protein [Vibrio cholerae]
MLLTTGCHRIRKVTLPFIALNLIQKSDAFYFYKAVWLRI